MVRVELAPWPPLDWGARLRASYALGVGMLAIHVLTAVYEWWRGYESLLSALFLDRSTRFRVDVGGQIDLLVEAGELFRLATSTLLHGDALHVLLNAIAVVVLGRLLEPWFGAVRLLAWFSFGAVVASVGSWAVGVTQSDGASGGAYALLGVAMVVGLRLRKQLGPEDRRLLGPILWAFTVLNLVLSVALPFIDVAGHVFGLGIGVVLGLVARLDPRGRPSWLGLGLGLLWLLIYAGACLGGWTWMVLTPSR